jgi:hypothetical protein
MALAKTSAPQKVTLTRTKDTKSYVRYETEAANAPLNNIYLSKEAVVALGSPNAVTVSIEAA